MPLVMTRVSSAGYTCVTDADALDMRVNKRVLSGRVGYWTINIGQAPFVQHPARNSNTTLATCCCKIPDNQRKRDCAPLFVIRKSVGSLYLDKPSPVGLGFIAH